MASPADLLHASIAREGFAFVQSNGMRELLAPYGDLRDWSTFAESWNRLELDHYMADGGRYRRRRHATFAAGPEGRIDRAPHQPHFQTIDYNPLNGGMARWFEPIEHDIAQSATMSAILRFGLALSSALAPGTHRWHIEVHQFRIEAREGEAGQPTPEGLHRDGVDFVLVLLVDRRNIASGMTTIHAVDGRTLGAFTLTDPLDTALVDDSRVAHGVTAVQAIDPRAPAHRDVLVVTFTQRSAGPATNS